MVRFAIPALAVALATVGCTEPYGSCDVDDDCAGIGSGLYCDSECQCCLARDPGDAGEPDAGTVPDAGCATECAPHEQCVGGGCAARYESLTITAPGADSILGTAAVTVQASLELGADRERSDPATLSVAATSGGADAGTSELTLMSAGSYAGVWTAPADGTYNLTVSYPEAGLMDSVTFTVDRAAPTFAVAVPAPPAVPDAGTEVSYVDVDGAFAGAWRRDQTVQLLVSSLDPDVDAASVRVAVKHAASPEYEVTPTASTECTGSPAYCGVAEVDLWRPEMKDFRGEFDIAVSGSDSAGNQGMDTAAGKILVTRWKWVFTETGGAQFKASPAIGPDGTIVAGTSAGNAGRLIALREDGSLRWETPGGAVIGSPAIGAGSNNVYVGQNTSTGAVVRALALLDGTEVVPPCQQGAGTTIESSLYVSNTQLSGETQPVETVTAIVNGTVGELLSLRPSGAGTKCRAGAILSLVPFPNTLSGSGTSAFTADVDGAVRAFDAQTGTWNEIVTDWPLAGFFPKSLAVVGNEVIGGGGPGKGGLFAVPFAGGTPWHTPTMSVAWNPVIGSNNTAYVGLNDGTLLHTILNQTPPTPLPDVGPALRAAPAVGQGNLIYLGISDGTVQARNVSTIDTPQWQITGLGAIDSSPALDCSRTPSGSARPGAPGVLYVGTNTGKLYAFIVDSRGIETVAPWPKYQHDPRNTGNALTSLAQFACP